MSKNHINLIKHKQKIKEKQDHKERYNKACDNAVEQKQQREASNNSKKSFKLQHLFASMILGFIAGISVMVTVNQMNDPAPKGGELNPTVGLKSKTEETNPLTSPKMGKEKIKIAVDSSIDPAIRQYQEISKKTPLLIAKKKAIIVQNELPRPKNRSIKPTCGNKNLKYSPFAGLKKVAKTPDKLRRQKIRELQKRVKNTAKRKKHKQSNSIERKKDKNSVVKKLKTKQQKQNKQPHNNSLPPDIAAEMRGEK